jgi:hypothetical protein
MIDDFTADDHFYAVIGRPSGFIEVESKESYYVQAADFAAGIASDVFATHKLIGVVGRFEYVSFNGIRVSRADAEAMWPFNLRAEVFARTGKCQSYVTSTVNANALPVPNGGVILRAETAATNSVS